MAHRPPDSTSRQTRPRRPPTTRPLFWAVVIAIPLTIAAVIAVALSAQTGAPQRARVTVTVTARPGRLRIA